MGFSIGGHQVLFGLKCILQYHPFYLPFSRIKLFRIRNEPITNSMDVLSWNVCSCTQVSPNASNKILLRPHAHGSLLTCSLASLCVLWRSVFSLLPLCNLSHPALYLPWLDHRKSINHYQIAMDEYQLLAIASKCLAIPLIQFTTADNLHMGHNPQRHDMPHRCPNKKP